MNKDLEPSDAFLIAMDDDPHCVPELTDNRYKEKGLFKSQIGKSLTLGFGLLEDDDTNTTVDGCEVLMNIYREDICIL